LNVWLPLQAGGFKGTLNLCEMKFNRVVGQIKEATTHSDLGWDLRDDLGYQLKLAADAFKEAMGTPGETSYGAVTDGLMGLLSSLPTLLNSGICAAAAELNLDRLVKLMTAVRGILSEQTSEHDSAYVTLVHSIDGLQASWDELGLRVREHSRLQGLDSKLRTVSGAGIPPGTMANEWRRIKEKRSWLEPPFSPQFEARTSELLATETAIDSAVEQHDEREATALLGQYLASVSSAFRDADTGLKDLCMRLSVVSQPLRTILDMC
jgi:hypothetical protein